MPDNDPNAKGQPRGVLTALIGPVAAALLLSTIPHSESGRNVQTTVTKQGTVEIVHADPQRYLRAYLDIAGVRTACDGLTGPDIGNRTFTEAECQTLLEQRLVEHAMHVEKCTPIDGNKYPYQTVAFIDFSYNLGWGAWCKSGAAKQVRLGNLTAACPGLLPYNKARVHGRLVPVEGLTKRRKREWEYCRTNLTPGATAANLPARLKGL